VHVLARASEHWYTSVTTLTIVLIVLTLALIGQGFYYRRVGPPRPVLVYRMPRPTPLLSSHLLRDAAGEIDVSFKGQAVNAPHIAAFRVESKARRDISDDDTASRNR
jgi:hypothetical protein